jgi:hypothetical protein
MNCPFLGHPTYQTIIKTHNTTAAYVASELFDSQEFQDWKGDNELPLIDNQGNVSSNSGDTFSINGYLNEYLQRVNEDTNTGDATQFDLNNPKSEDYQLVNNELVFRPNPITNPKYQKPHKVDSTTESDVRNIAERLKSKFGIDYQVITDSSKHWAGKYENGKATINLAFASSDTPFHEYAHPFVDTIKSTNAALYQSLTNEITQEKSILRKTKARYPELLGSDLIDEAIVQAIGEYAAGTLESPSLRQKIKELLQTISQFLGELFHEKYVLPAELPANLTLRQLGVLMNSEFTIPIQTSEALKYQKLFNINELKSQANENQLKALNTLEVNAAFVKFTEEGHTYKDENGIEYTPTTSAIGTTWEGEDNKESLSLIWGSQADAILSAVIENRNLPDTPNIEDIVKKELETKYNSLVNELRSDGSLLLTQAILSDASAKIAGSADLIRVRPDGSIDIYDLKTSKASTLDDKYDRKFTGNGITRSKRQQHAAQVSTYKALAERMGLKVNTLHIIPVKLDVSFAKVTGITSEPIIDLQPSMQEANNLLGEFSRKNDNTNSSSQKDYTKFLNKLKIILQEKITKLENSLVDKKTQGASSVRLRELKDLQSELQGVDSVKEISKVVNTLYEELVVGTTEKGSIISKFDKLIQSIPAALAQNDPTNTERVIKSLNHYLDYVEDFKDFDSFKQIYADSVAAKVGIDVDSPLHKLGKIIETRDAIKESYNKAMIPVVAATLSEVIDTNLQRDVMNEMQAKERYKIKAESARSLGKIKQAERFDKLYQDARSNLKNLTADKFSIIDQLSNSRQDLGMLEFLTGNLTSSSDSILGLFAKKLKSVFYRIDESMNVLQREAIEEFNLFAKGTKRNQDDPEAFNKGLYEVVTTYRKDKSGNYYAVEEKNFVQEVDVNRYNKAIYDRNQAADKISDDPKNKDRRKFLSQWYADNHIALEESERQSIIDEKNQELEKGYISKEEYKQWENENYIKKDGKVVGYKGDLSRPNPTLYSSKAYQDIQANPVIKRYYDYLLKLHFQSQARLPISKQLGYRLPSGGKSLEDTVREKGGLKHLLPHLKDEFFKTAKDNDRYNENKVVPVYMTHFMPANEVSNDLLSLSLMFSQTSSTYEAIVGTVDKVGIEQEANALLNIFKERDIHKLDSKGQTIAKQAAAKLGITDENLSDKKGGYYALFFEHFIDQNIYGVGEQKVLVDLPNGEKLDVGKTVNKFMQLASIPALGGPFTVLKAIANKFNASYNVILEAIGGQHFNWESYRKGEATYNKWAVKDMMRDFSNPISQSVNGQLMDLYSPMQGHFKDHFGKEITWSAGKKLMQPGTWFFMQNAGEHSTQMAMFFAMMSNQKVNQSGKEISLLDAYELDSKGVIKLKDGIEWGDKEKDEFTNKIHALNKLMHGVYNKMDKSVAQKHAIGRLAFMYRKFLVPAVKRRWGAVRSDQELGSTIEGFHRTLLRTARHEWQELVSYMLGKENKLSPLEKSNIRKSLFEIGTTILLSSMLMVMAGMKDRDPDLKKGKGLNGWMFNAGMYEIMRLNSELQFFFPVPGVGLDDDLRVFTSPSAANSSLTKFVRFTNNLFFHTFEVYDEKNAWYDQGESKVKTSLFSLLGVYSSDPVRQAEQFSKLVK